MKWLFGKHNEAESNKAEPNKKKEERPPLSPEEAEKIRRDMEMINRARELQSKNRIITARVPDWAWSDPTQSYSVSGVCYKCVFLDPEDEKKYNSIGILDKGRFFDELYEKGRVKRVPIESDD